jgi:hypothetical protein
MGEVAIKLPCGLKLIAVLTIIGGVTSIIGRIVPILYQGWLEVVLGTLSAAAGIGLLVRKKWAWLVVLVSTALTMVLSVLSLPFFPMFFRTVLMPFGVGACALYISMMVVGDLYCGFCLYYLLRRRTRTLFGIGSPRA